MDHKQVMDSVDEEELEYSDIFEKKEWGYVRRDWQQPEGPDRPVVLTLDGYTGASSAEDGPSHYLRMSDGLLLAMSIGIHDRPELSDEYVAVQSSVRATGCSDGGEDQFEPYDRVGHGRDGYEMIEWLADRSWALDRVGLWGISYSGMTVLHVASTQPPSLACVVSNVIMGDILRGRTFPGGVDNVAYDVWVDNLPVVWWDDDHPFRGNIVPDDDPICVEHRGDRDNMAILEQLDDWYRDSTENAGYYARSFVTQARKIKVPTYISQAWQDGQTGQRGGPAVYNALDPDPIDPDDFPGGNPPSPELRDSPKLLRASTGYHGDVWRYLSEDRDQQPWFDYWLLGEDTGIMEEAPVKLDFGLGTEESQGAIDLDGFPDSDTAWERYYISGNYTLSTEPPESSGSDTYTSNVPDYWFIDDLTGDGVLTYWSEPVETPKVIAGTITATLYMESSEEDTEMFVSLADMGPNGDQVTYLQRGMMRASHRTLDEYQTRYNEKGEITRPVHTMTNPTPIIPDEIYRYDIEVFPLGHIIYPGHRLLVNIHDPPLLEGGEPGGPRYWMYNVIDNKSYNTLHYGKDCRSSILFPMLDWPEENDLPIEPECGEPTGYDCVDVNLPWEMTANQRHYRKQIQNSEQPRRRNR
jgi:hypothetical protein